MNKKYLFYITSALFILSSAFFSACGGGSGGSSSGVDAGGGTSVQTLNIAEQAAQFIILGQKYIGCKVVDHNVWEDNKIVKYNLQCEAIQLNSDNTFILYYYSLNQEKTLYLPLIGKFEIYDFEKRIIKLNVDQDSACFPGQTLYYSVESDEKLQNIQDNVMDINLTINDTPIDPGSKINCSLKISASKQP